MILFRPLTEAYYRLQTRIALSSEFSLCRVRDQSVRTFQSIIEQPGLDKHHYVAIVADRPGSDESLRFCGLSSASIGTAARKAFAEYLEAKTLWELGADEETSRSGWACAENEQKAFERSYKELLERDSLIMHFLCADLASDPIPAFKGSEKFELVKLQSVDPEYTVVFCGHFLEAEKRWLLGGACEKNLSLASEKALLEVAMMRKDWIGIPPEEGKDQAKGEALWPHWDNLSNSDVTFAIENFLRGGGRKKLFFFADRKKIIKNKVKKFSNTHVVVGTSHPDLCKLSFGSKWKNSEPIIRKTLKLRGLEIKQWMIHPML
jgi:hypothetical protein